MGVFDRGYDLVPGAPEDLVVGRFGVLLFGQFAQLVDAEGGHRGDDQGGEEGAQAVGRAAEEVEADDDREPGVDVGGVQPQRRNTENARITFCKNACMVGSIADMISCCHSTC